MEDGYRLIDYGINLNDVVQLMVRAAPIPTSTKDNEEKENTDESQKNSKKSGDETLCDAVCEYYEVRT